MGTVVSIHVLSRGIDTLYWSTACGIDAERFADLRSARDGAADQEDRVREVDGYALTVEPHGAGRYPVLLTAAEFSVQLTASEHIPTAFVQLRSAFLHGEDGPEAAFARSKGVAHRKGVGYERALDRILGVRRRGVACEWLLLRALQVTESLIALADGSQTGASL